MDRFWVFLLVGIGIVAATGVVSYFVLRRLFLRAADRIAHHIERALLQLATGSSGRRVGKAPSARQVRAATGRLTHLGAYAAAEGLSEEAARAEFARSIERVSRLMDSAIRLPILGGVGLDALLGLFPFAGDAISAAISLLLIHRSVRYGIPREIITKMLANVLVDLLVGAMPLLGDVADVWFKSNMRNLALLKEYLGDEAHEVIDAEVVRPA
ncbi:MAG TPA: DUF4112 domain-containing protein [Vicinamibacterales bacterium]|nr:DUF4112 domain-containing protein [Vicinamibacterales bacterium]